MVPVASTIAAAPRWRLSTRSPRRISTRTGSDWWAWLDIALALWRGEKPPCRARRGDASGLVQHPGPRAPCLARRPRLSMVAPMHRLAFCAAFGVAVLLALPAQPQTKTAPAQPAAKQPAAAAPTPPPQPQKLGAAQSWTAYSAPEKGGQICYVVGEPSKNEPAGGKQS